RLWHSYRTTGATRCRSALRERSQRARAMADVSLRQTRSHAAGLEPALRVGFAGPIAPSDWRPLADGESRRCLPVIAGTQEFRESCAEDVTEWGGHSCPPTP